MSIKRYTPSGVHHTSVYLDLDADGPVVMYDDHVAEVARLQARERELESAIRAYFRAEWGWDPVDPSVARDELENVMRLGARPLVAALAAVSAETEGAS